VVPNFFFQENPTWQLLKKSNNQLTLAKNLMGLNLGGFTFIKNYTLLSTKLFSFHNFIHPTISSLCFSNIINVMRVGDSGTSSDQKWQIVDSHLKPFTYFGVGCP
jgi:hypothetical protein